jgi:hypothetical protein
MLCHVVRYYRTGVCKVNVCLGFHPLREHNEDTTESGVFDEGKGRRRKGGREGGGGRIRAREGGREWFPRSHIQ